MSEEILDKNTIVGNLYGIVAALGVVSEKLDENEDYGMYEIVSALKDRLAIQVKDLDKWNVAQDQEAA